MEITNLDLIKFLKLSESINSAFSDNPKYGFDLDIDSFMLRAYNLNPQKYGLRVQAYFSLMMGYESIPSSHDLGDFRNKEGEEVELKCSFLTMNNEYINIKQIRTWQDLKYYYVFAIDFNDFEMLKYECFKLSKEQMLEEMKHCNAKPVHSTKEKNEGNTNIEYGFSIKVGSKNYDRWCELYKLKNFNIRKICQDKLKEESFKSELQNTIMTLEARLAIQSEEENELLDKEMVVMQDWEIGGPTGEPYYMLVGEKSCSISEVYAIDKKFREKTTSTGFLSALDRVANSVSEEQKVLMMFNTQKEEVTEQQVVEEKTRLRFPPMKVK